MQVRWRQQEIVFASVIVAMLAIQVPVEQLSGAQLPLSSTRQSFELIGQPFNLFWNYLLPRVAPFIALLLIIASANLWLIPLLQKSFRVSALLVFTSISYIGLAGVLALSYWLEGAYLKYQSSEIGLQQLATSYALKMSLAILLPMAGYIILRELFINHIEKNKKHNEFWVLLCNKITSAVFIYIGGFIFFYIFGILRSDVAGIFYTFYLGALIINCFINIYALFPLMYRSQMPFSKFIWRFLIAPFLLALVEFLIFVGIAHNPNWIFPASVFLFVLVIGFPISWIIFQQQKEKLESFTKLRKDLGKTSANLQLLRSQINPHFLFNILNTIYGTAIQEKAVKTADNIQRLGDMMRFMMDENNQDYIPLDREIEYLKQYLFLQQSRTQGSDTITITSVFPEETCQNSIAPMLLVPFVENAFKHGVRMEQKSWINIRLLCNPDSILFEISNSLHAISENDPEKDRNGIGLENVKERLQLLYPGKHELILHESKDEFLVRLNISTL